MRVLERPYHLILKKCSQPRYAYAGMSYMSKYIQVFNFVKRNISKHGLAK
jgi:hypothetical protein